MIDLFKNGGVNCKKCNNFIDLDQITDFEFEMSSGLTGSSFRGLCGGDESCDTSYGWDEIEGYPRTEDVNEEESK